jgi:hypothetical protein
LLLPKGGAGTTATQQLRRLDPWLFLIFIKRNKIKKAGAAGAGKALSLRDNAFFTLL